MPAYQNRHDRDPIEFVLNMPMIRISKLGERRSTKADSNKCLVSFRGVMVKFATEVGRCRNRPWGLGISLSEFSILRVHRNTKTEMMQKTTKLLPLNLNVPLSIQPQSPALGQSENSVSKVVQI